MVGNKRRRYGIPPPLWTPVAGVTKWGVRNDEIGEAGRLDRHDCLRVAGGEGVHVGEDEVAGAVAAELGLVLAADYGEGAEDVAGVVPVQAVEVEVEGVEAGPEVPALLLVPGERRARVAEVAGEGGHVVGGVGEPEDVVPDQLAGGRVSELPVVVVERDDR